MKRLFLLIVPVVLLSCHSNNIPDVSKIDINLTVKRFEQDFFGMDTVHFSKSINLLREKYPGFLPEYFHNVLGLPFDSHVDDSGEVPMAVKRFLHDYMPVKDSTDKVFRNFDKWENQIHDGLQFVKYYFPNYKVPSEVITFIGPFDAFFATSFGIQGDVLTQEGLGVGLQLHLGKNFSFFKSETGQELYPEYISSTFDPDYIAIDCIRNIVDDLFPPEHLSSSLIEQMVNNGKRYYLLSKFMPRTREELLMGYTPEQLKAAYKNEAIIWDFFLNNNLLNTTDQNIIKNYIGQAPKTQEFGEGSPGNLGSFAGLQIVKKFIEKFPETTLPQLMAMPPRQLYEQSKYKPRS